MDNSTTLTSYDLAMLNSFGVLLGEYAPQDQWNIITKELILKLGNLYTQNPAPAPQEVMDLMQWSPDTYAYIDYFGGPLNETATYFAGQLAYAPHPRNTMNIIPLFVVFTVISTIVMVLRFWSRISVVGKIQSFDWVALFSYLCIVAWGAAAVAEHSLVGEWSAMYDQSYTTVSTDEAFWEMLLAVYPLAVLTIKAALLVFYYNLSTWRPLRISVFVVAFICFGNAMGGFFGWLFQCNHVDIWHYPMSSDLSCTVKILPLTQATGIINIITDVMIWIIPMPLVWKLQLYPRERYLAVLTFGLGAIACIASIVRVISLQNALNLGVSNGGSLFAVTAWAIVELNLAIICASAPALRALVIKHAPKILSYARSGSQGSEKTSGWGFHSKGSNHSQASGPYDEKKPSVSGESIKSSTLDSPV